MKKKMITAAIVPAVLAGSLALATPAEATTGGCKDGRCNIYLSKAETRQMANGMQFMDIAMAAKGNPVLIAAITTMIFGHQLIASQYANRGWCSKFSVSIYPWENQGYQGYRC
ncbi:hypothetical protein [Mycobacterium sp. M26]|uniref:hypothetical protein n=1 Tax=Mycobacterium sp. M26 TaxID=1762962 RepID=UPI00073F0E24|nr:hypothetical protein [Mycobacterium sp. M26]